MNDNYNAILFLLTVLFSNYFVSIFVSIACCSIFVYCDNFWWGFILFFPVAYVVGYVWYLFSLKFEKKMN